MRSSYNLSMESSKALIKEFQGSFLLWSESIKSMIHWNRRKFIVLTEIAPIKKNVNFYFVNTNLHSNWHINLKEIKVVLNCIFLWKKNLAVVFGISGAVSLLFLLVPHCSMNIIIPKENLGKLPRRLPPLHTDRFQKLPHPRPPLLSLLS